VGARDPRKPSRAAREANPRRLASFEGPRSRTVLSSGSSERTAAIGRAMGGLLPAGAVVSLEGGLGVGKTVLAKGICAGLGVRDEVTSPSFILAEEYRGELPVFHFDLYRLTRLGEVSEIGLFDAIDGRNIVIIEWGDRLPCGALGIDVEVVMRIAGADEREIAVSAAAGFCGAIEEALA
jgi:tRNA threonylcarbamoyladenosine biosynthesis protein TsaE